jgi:endoglycosylceramidase
MRLPLTPLVVVAALTGCGGSSSGGGASSTAAAATSASSSTPVATTAPVPTPPKDGDLLSPLDVRSGVLRDARGRQHLLRGVNYAGRAKWPPFTGWARPSDVDAIRKLGMDHVRFLITWHAVEPTDGVFDDVYLAEVATILGWFEAAGIRVILDMHQDQYALRFGGDGFPEWMILDPDPFPGVPDIMASFPFNYANPKVIANFDAFYADQRKRARLARAWTHVVSKLKGSKALVGYDLLNEPFFGVRSPVTFEATVLAQLNAELLAAVRAEDPDRIVFFEPQLQAGLFVSTGLTPMSDPNVVYAPHWYDLEVDARAALGLHPAYNGNASFTAAALDRLLGHARTLGCPTWIGEYGVLHAQTGAASYLLDHHRLFDERLLSGCAWTIDTATPSTYSCLDTNGQPLPIADQWAHPHPRAVAGTLERTSYDPTTRTLEVRWREGGLGPDAPTIVELPHHLLRAGAPLVVLLADPPGTWRFERDPTSGRLLVWADPATSVHTLTVRPH